MLGLTFSCHCLEILLEGWDGEGGGSEVRIGNTCIPVTDSC